MKSGKCCVMRGFYRHSLESKFLGIRLIYIIQLTKQVILFCLQSFRIRSLSARPAPTWPVPVSQKEIYYLHRIDPFIFVTFHYLFLLVLNWSKTHFKKRTLTNTSGQSNVFLHSWDHLEETVITVELKCIIHSHILSGLKSHLKSWVRVGILLLYIVRDGDGGPCLQFCACLHGDEVWSISESVV